MSKNRHLFTSESVTEGHPDKIADQISDAILDAILAHDPHGRASRARRSSRPACAIVAGEITTNALRRHPEDRARDDQATIGYTSADVRLRLRDVRRHLGDRQAVARHRAWASTRAGAGDQGLMFGFACDETEELMPLPITLAHQLARGSPRCARRARSTGCAPTARAQVTVEYDGRQARSRVDTVVVSTQHSPTSIRSRAREAIREEIIKPVVPAKLLGRARRSSTSTRRAASSSVGPQGDTGLTGRKIIVDTYGGMGRHGGGAFSGKDPTKVDRSAVVHGALHREERRRGGARRPLRGAARVRDRRRRAGVGLVDTFGTAKVDPRTLCEARPRALPAHAAAGSSRRSSCGARSTGRRPRTGTSAGRLPEFTWEKTDKAAALAAAAGAAVPAKA